MPKINEAGLNLLKQFEGCVLHAYPDPGTGGDPWTIGYGHTGPEVKPGLVITQAQADALLCGDLSGVEQFVNDHVTHSLTPNQFSALVSFTYNVGEGAFEDSTLLRLVNQGNIAAAAQQFARWTYGGGRQLPGLVRRRAAEAQLFLTPEENAA